MKHVLQIARWEWFKLQRRRLPWILLAILVAFSQLGIWGSYVAYETTLATGGRVMLPFGAGIGAPRMINCNDLQSRPAEVLPAGTARQVSDELLQQCRQQQARMAVRVGALIPTGSVTSSLNLATSLGLVLLGILAASVVGIEYGLGTLRPILARGPGRLSYLAGKYLMLIGTATAMLLIIGAAAAGSGTVVAHAVSAQSIDSVAARAWSDIGVSFVKALAALITYLTIAGTLTLLVRSAAAGMAISVGYYIIESVFVRIMSTAFKWFDHVAQYLPLRNISALVGGGGINMTNGNAANAIGTLHAGLVLAAYVVAFAGLSALVFRDRDIGGAAGG